MSGIRSAMERVIAHDNEGLCLAKGTIPRQIWAMGLNGENVPERNHTDVGYILVRIRDDKILNVYDYGSDVRIADDIKQGDKVRLVILDNYSACWQKVQETKVMRAKKIEKVLSVEKSDDKEETTIQADMKYDGSVIHLNGNFDLRNLQVFVETMERLQAQR